MLLIIGILLIAAGGGLYYLRQQQLNKALDIKYYETSTAKQVIDLYNDVKDTVEVGNYSGTIVELSGMGIANNPLTAPHSQRPVIYYEATVEREYEVTEQERDNEGNYRTVNRRSSETVSKQSEYAVFTFNDGSGATLNVDMQGANKELVQSVDRFEAEAPAGFNLNLSFGGANVGNSRTIGYRYKERIIPNNTKLYILGEVTDRSGELLITKPKEKGKPFIVSTKSEDELVRGAESSAKWQFIGAIASAVIGVILIIASFF